jgi:hypothetical protein
LHGLRNDHIFETQLSAQGIGQARGGIVFAMDDKGLLWFLMGGAIEGNSHAIPLFIEILLASFKEFQGRIPEFLGQYLKLFRFMFWSWVLWPESSLKERNQGTSYLILFSSWFWFCG